MRLTNRVPDRIIDDLRDVGALTADQATQLKCRHPRAAFHVTYPENFTPDEHRAYSCPDCGAEWTRTLTPLDQEEEQANG